MRALSPLMVNSLPIQRVPPLIPPLVPIPLPSADPAQLAGLELKVIPLVLKEVTRLTNGDQLMEPTRVITKTTEPKDPKEVMTPPKEPMDPIMERILPRTLMDLRLTSTQWQATTASTQRPTLTIPLHAKETQLRETTKTVPKLMEDMVNIIILSKT